MIDTLRRLTITCLRTQEDTSKAWAYPYPRSTTKTIRKLTPMVEDLDCRAFANEEQVLGVKIVQMITIRFLLIPETVLWLWNEQVMRNWRFSRNFRTALTGDGDGVEKQPNRDLMSC